MQKVPPRLRTFAKEQRRTMTRAETVLWRELRAARFAGAKFRRQVPIGPYIVDYLCFSRRLIVVLGNANLALDEIRAALRVPPADLP